MDKYDIAIIGSGPGGYVAGLYASGSRMKVCIIEKAIVGGTCLNRGCIPTKALLASASVISTVRDAGSFGVNVDGCGIDFPAMMARKAEIVNRLRTGIETLFRAKKVDLKRGCARIAAPGVVSIDGREKVSASKIIVATGSAPVSIRGIPIDEKDVLSSDGILELAAIPPRLVVIGGGVIGCEFAHLFNVLGSKVTVIEMLDRLVPTQSAEASKKLDAIFRKRGIDTRLSSGVCGVAKMQSGLNVSLRDGSTLDADKVLVSVGRRATLDGLGLEESGVTEKNGMICVDGHLSTASGDIYAIGDCVEGPKLAHKASYDGILACDNIAGQARTVNYSNMPNCIWTDPEIASVGLTEEAARKACPDVKIAKFPYLASGKAYIDRKTEGFVKISGTPDGRILGVEIMGKEACDLIGDAVVAMTAGMTVKDWSLAVRAHPTLSETLQEAAHAFCGHSIHTI